MMRAVRFDSVYGFKYSQRLGTTAARVPDDVPEAEKKARLAEVLALADALREARLKEYAGTVQRVLVEGPSKQSRTEAGTPQLSGRTRANIVVNFPVDNAATGAWRFVGKTIDIEIKRSLSHSLYGEVVLVQ